MRKFIAQSCAFLGTFRHSHAPLSPRFSLSLAHPFDSISSPMPVGHTSPLYVAYARWAYVAGCAMCSLSLRAYASPLFVAYALRAYVAGCAMCSLTLRAYARLFSVPLRIRLCRQALSLPSFFPIFTRTHTCGEACRSDVNAFLYSIQRLRRLRQNSGAK